jgi:hypothetical protein
MRRDRFHNLAHSDYFKPRFAEEYWVPARCLELRWHERTVALTDSVVVQDGSAANRDHSDSPPCSLMERQRRTLKVGTRPGMMQLLLFS